MESPKTASLTVWIIALQQAVVFRLHVVVMVCEPPTTTMTSSTINTLLVSITRTQLSVWLNLGCQEPCAVSVSCCQVWVRGQGVPGSWSGAAGASLQPVQDCGCLIAVLCGENSNHCKSHCDQMFKQVVLRMRQPPMLYISGWWEAAPLQDPMPPPTRCSYSGAHPPSPCCSTSGAMQM